MVNHQKRMNPIRPTIANTAGPAARTAGPTTTLVRNSQPTQKASQTINVTQHAPASAVYNTSFPVAATATSGLAVSIAAVSVKLSGRWSLMSACVK